MSRTKMGRQTLRINFPANTDLDQFVYHYRALFDAHRIKNNIPETTTIEPRLRNALPELQRQLEQDFKSVNALIYQLKSEYGRVELHDMVMAQSHCTFHFNVGK